MLQKNSCFLDIGTLLPFEDQWGFLEKQEKVSTSFLDGLYESFFGKSDDKAKVVINRKQADKLEIATRSI